MARPKKETSAVKASDQSMTLDPLENRIAESVGSVRDIISKVENRKSAVRTEESPRRTKIDDTGTEPPRPQRFYSGGAKIATPAGPCPIKPKGYKENWPDGPASDEVVQNWAMDVYNYGEGKYAIDAVIYFARHFWDINGQEYRRIRDLIVTTLRPSRPLESEELA